MRTTTSVLGDLTNGRLPATKKKLALLSPDIEVFEEPRRSRASWKAKQSDHPSSYDESCLAKLACQEAELEQLRALVEQQKAEKAALTMLGRGFFAVRIQRVARGRAARFWFESARPLLVRLQSAGRGWGARKSYGRARAACVRLQTTARRRSARGAFRIAVAAAVAAQTVVRTRGARRRFADVRSATIVAQTTVRARIARAGRRKALKATTDLARVFRGHAVRRVDPAHAARRYVASAIAHRTLRTLLSPPPGTVVVTPRLENTHALVEAKLVPDGQPFALAFKLDPYTGDLGVWFVANPTGDLRQIIAPWTIRGQVVVTVLNMSKPGKDAKFKIDDILDLTTYGNLITRRLSPAIGVPCLIPRDTLDNFFFDVDERALVVTVCNNTRDLPRRTTDDIVDGKPALVCPTNTHARILGGTV